MISNKNNIIILGCQRSGKTTLTNLLSQKYNNYCIFPLDSLVSAFSYTFPELGLDRKSKITNKSKIFAPFMASYIKNFQVTYPEKNYILEGCQILPEDLISQSQFNSCKIICLGYPNTTIDEMFHHIRLNDKYLPPYNSTYMTDDILKKNIELWIKYSQYLQIQAKKLNIPFFETNGNRTEIFNKIIDSLEDYER